MVKIQKNKVDVIIQARWSSSRFEGKILKKIANKTLLEILITRLKKSQKISNIYVSTSTNKKDFKIVNECKRLKIDYFKGSEDDVLSRYYHTAKKFNIKNILRITSDCPFSDPLLIDSAIDYYFKKNLDYLSNTSPPTYPDGLDLEVFNFKTLEQAFNNSVRKFDREHVTPYIRRNKNLKKGNYKNIHNYSHLRLTVDEPIDLKVLEAVVKNIKNFKFNFRDIIDLYKKKPELFRYNSKLIRNEGSKMNTGQKLWKRSIDVIPGGTMLFSKNPDLHLPEKWPAYYSKAKDTFIWDLDNKKYIDMHLMGIGTNILGYARKEIDNYVKSHIDLSNVSTLNNPYEIKLAEKLISMHKWADMVRFARTGGEANLIALRAARATTGRSKVAICGYHGWHDWYLSANLTNKKNLNQLLLNNLSTKGVPKELKNSVYPFKYNDYESLEKITTKNSISAIIMEVSRYEKPKKNFLKKIRKLCNKKNIVLIFDECTSGFRNSFGGLHLSHKVNPDIAVLGKALGNGYAITAVIGKRNIMENLSTSFTSSTFWTEKIGTVAAIKTLDVMEKEKSWELISSLGNKIKKKWLNLAKRNNLKINVMGLNALPAFRFSNRDNLICKTFITQELLKDKILGSNTIYVSTLHDNKKILEKYYFSLAKIFEKINKYDDKKLEELINFKKTITGLRG